MKAVNGAGENASPSNNVSIPSLPAIGPVTASLTHQVWKYDREIRVNVSFQVRNNGHNNTTNIDSTFSSSSQTFLHGYYNKCKYFYPDLK